jgi:3-isopropylmalate dehydratase small subunit
MLLPDGTTYDFEVDPFARQMLLAGTDEIGWVLQRVEAIDAWEAAHPARVDTTPIVGGTVPGAIAPSAA